MSQQYDNTNKGVLFDNDRKESDKHPDFKGSINVDGKDYWLSAWLSDEGAKYYCKLSVQPKEARQGASKGSDRKPAPSRGGGGSDGFVSDPVGDGSDDIPFATNRGMW